VRLRRVLCDRDLPCYRCIVVSLHRCIDVQATISAWMADGRALRVPRCTHPVVATPPPLPALAPSHPRRRSHWLVPCAFERSFDRCTASTPHSWRPVASSRRHPR
jgi:hypothetical protein